MRHTNQRLHATATSVSSTHTRHKTPDTRLFRRLGMNLVEGLTAVSLLVAPSSVFAQGKTEAAKAVADGATAQTIGVVSLAAIRMLEAQTEPYRYFTAHDGKRLSREPIIREGHYSTSIELPLHNKKALAVIATLTESGSDLVFYIVGAPKSNGRGFDISDEVAAFEARTGKKLPAVELLVNVDPNTPDTYNILVVSLDAPNTVAQPGAMIVAGLTFTIHGERPEPKGGVSPMLIASAQ